MIKKKDWHPLKPRDESDGSTEGAQPLPFAKEDVITKGTKKAFDDNGWFKNYGVYAIMDGQFGSTGKGLLAAVMAQAGGQSISVVVTNSGPNSGHTSYWRGKRVQVHQVPTAGIHLHKAHLNRAMLYFTAGAIIDPKRLIQELYDYDINPASVFVHPLAALVKDEHKAIEKQKVRRIASTMTGTGAALAEKVMRGEVVRDYFAKADSLPFS